MIRAALILAILMSTFTSAKAQVWATAISKHKSDGTVIVFRYMKEFAKGFDRTKQPIRILVVWDYAGEKGLPSLEERQRMDELEDALQPLQEKGFSTLAIVSTGNNFKEWTYYAQEEDAFLAGLNLALRSRPRFPIEIHIAPDPSWTTYERFAAGIQE